MADELTPQEAQADVVPKDEPKIMCYVSKEMVPVSQTIEVDYGGNKTFRVLPKYVKFETPAE